MHVALCCYMQWHTRKSVRVPDLWFHSKLPCRSYAVQKHQCVLDRVAVEYVEEIYSVISLTRPVSQSAIAVQLDLPLAYC